MAPPFINSTGLVTKILDKIIEAPQPERFTQDFLDKLGYGNSGSAKPFIPLLKRLQFLASDGTPTPLYAQFRNPENRGSTVSQALRAGYKEIYDRNETAHDLPREKFKNLVVEITGLAPDSQTVGAIVGTSHNSRTTATSVNPLRAATARLHLKKAVPLLQLLLPHDSRERRIGTEPFVHDQSQPARNNGCGYNNPYLPQP